MSPGMNHSAKDFGPTVYFLTPQYGRHCGGLGVSAERISGYLRRSYRVVIFTPDKDVPPGTFTRTDEPGLVQIRFPPAREEKLGTLFLSDLIEHLARELPPALIIGFYGGPISYAGAFSAGMLDVPFIICLRGNDIDQDIFGADGFALSFCLRKAARTVCVSREQMKKVTVFCPEARLSYIPNGVDPVLFPAREGVERTVRLVIGIFGDIKEKKGLDLLLAAFDEQRFSLRIVGSLRDEAAKALHGTLLLHPGATPQIVHIPYLKSASGIVDEYHRCDVICIPSIHEGMANVMLEAMSCGKVVVASAVGGALDVIRDGDNGLLFQSRDRDSLATALDRAASLDAGSFARLGAKARETIIQEFSAASEAARYLQLLEELLSPPMPPT